MKSDEFCLEHFRQCISIYRVCIMW